MPEAVEQSLLLLAAVLRCALAGATLLLLGMLAALGMPAKVAEYKRRECDAIELVTTAALSVVLLVLGLGVSWWLLTPGGRPRGLGALAPWWAILIGVPVGVLGGAWGLLMAWAYLVGDRFTMFLVASALWGRVREQGLGLTLLELFRGTLTRPATSRDGGGSEGSGEMVQRVLSEYGRDLPEDRSVAGATAEGIRLANAGDWDSATEKLHEGIAEQPDYDVPHVWLADCLKHRKGASAAVSSLMGGARVCRRKSNLLAKAAEMSLLEQPWRGRGDFVELFAQAMGALAAKPGQRAFEKQRPFLFWRELCDAFDDGDGAAWAARVAGGSCLNDDLKAQIWSGIGSDPDYARSSFIAWKVKSLGVALAERFPA